MYYVPLFIGQHAGVKAVMPACRSAIKFENSGKGPGLIAYQYFVVG